MNATKLACASIWVALATCAVAIAEAAPVKARFSMATSQSHPYYVGALKFKEVLEAESKGQILLDIYTDAQAGDEAASLQLMRSGALQFAEHSSSLGASMLNAPKLQAWSLPFLYPDAETAYRAWDSDTARKSFAEFEKAGVKCLVLWDAGFRQLSSNKPVNSIADAKGLKVRTPNGAVYINTWKALGAVPAPMAFAELYTSLQTGNIDATELPAQAINSGKFFEVQKNVAIINYINDPICLSVSTRFYNSLTPELKQAVDKAATASAQAERAVTQGSFQKAVDELKKNGMAVTNPDLGPFRQAASSLYDDYYRQSGEGGRALVKAILNFGKAN